MREWKLCLAWLWAAALATPAAAEKPNVVLIMADDLGYEGLSCNGSASYETPNLDRLAKTGARFEHCYTTPLCTPTRVQIMTGRYTHRSYTTFGRLSREERTFAHMLKQAGYATAVAGKWQLGWEKDGHTPATAGFDAWCLWNYRIGDQKALGHRFADPNLIYRDPKTGEEKFRTYEGGYGPDVCANYLIDFMERSVRRDEPFFAYYPMLLTHPPFKPTPATDAWEQNPHERDPSHFDDMVAYMDRLVGRIVKKLEALGVRDETLLLFVGDNGTHQAITTEMESGRTIHGGKGLFRESGTHVPLVVNWPGKISPGQVRDELVDTTDFVPTLADATGASLPEPPGDGVIDGRSFLPPLLGKEGNPRDWVLVSYTEKRQDNFGWPRARFVRNRRYKLYGFYERKTDGETTVKTGHLYDTAKDPKEQRPLGENAKPTLRARFQKILDRLPSTE